MTQVRVRFAPSPTGYLHIGGARTAFINWLYAKQNNGLFLLRIDNTDIDRSSDACTDAILQSLKWLNLQYDGDIVVQSDNIKRHTDVAYQLLADSKAYKCYCSKTCRDNTVVAKHVCRCIDTPISNTSAPYTIRLKVPRDVLHDVCVNDMIKGKTVVKIDTIDDFIILRSDGTPTYMLSSVVDDHDMGITHVIRGDDHFTNTFRQCMIYHACDWKQPTYGHIPLIYGDDGHKLSKRHGAVGVHDYQKMGYLPDALLMFLYSMGFGNNIDVNKGISNLVSSFKLNKMSKSASRMDFCILNKINQQVMRDLVNRQHIINCLSKYADYDVVCKALPDILPRSYTINDAINMLKVVYLTDSVVGDGGVDTIDSNIVVFLKTILVNSLTPSMFDKSVHLQAQVTDLCGTHGISLKNTLDALRWIITKQQSSPNIYNVMYALGYDTCVHRISKY